MYIVMEKKIENEEKSFDRRMDIGGSCRKNSLELSARELNRSFGECGFTCNSELRIREDKLMLRERKSF